MYKVFLSAIALMFVLLISCEDSSGPDNSSLFTFDKILDESLLVYGPGWQEIPQSQWNDSTKSAYNIYNDELEGIKDIEYELTDTQIIGFYEDKSEGYPYEMKGDTITVSIGEEFYLYIARKIDENTLEMEQYAFYEIDEYNMSYAMGTGIGGYDEYYDEFIDKNNEISENSLVCAFFRRVRFTK